MNLGNIRAGFFHVGFPALAQVLVRLFSFWVISCLLTPIHIMISVVSVKLPALLYDLNIEEETLRNLLGNIHDFLKYEFLSFSPFFLNLSCQYFVCLFFLLQFCAEHIRVLIGCKHSFFIGWSHLKQQKLDWPHFKFLTWLVSFSDAPNT